LSRVRVVSAPDPIVRVEGLAKTFPGGVQALAGVSFAVASGEFVGILGPSGAGKTTLFRCLTGLARPDRGSVEIHGRDICRLGGRDLRAARREVAMIFQQFNLIRRLSGIENVLAGRLASLPTWRVLTRSFARADRQMALGCLDTVGLLDKAYTRADQLSGGQQQRVAIARALAQEATVLLADEPVASLDPESAATVLETLRSVASRGVAIIASLHQVGLATDYADRIIALRDGQILEDAPTGTFDARALEQIYERSAAPARDLAGA
jgi:phosphonate transport system ATP-binding protein